MCDPLCSDSDIKDARLEISGMSGLGWVPLDKKMHPTFSEKIMGVNLERLEIPDHSKIIGLVYSIMGSHWREETVDRWSDSHS